MLDLRGRGANKFALYTQGIIRQADIPLESLNARQRHQVEATLGHVDQVDKQAVRDFLASLWYPLCFLDFETVNPAIMTYDGLEIADGDMAMSAYEAMKATKDPAEIARLRRALLDYCRVDTLGLVRILERLRELAT